MGWSDERAGNERRLATLRACCCRRVVATNLTGCIWSSYSLKCLLFVDRVLVLQEGRLVNSGSPAELAARLPMFAALRSV